MEEKEYENFVNFFNRVRRKVDMKKHITWDRLTSAVNHILKYCKEDNLNWNDIALVSSCLVDLSFQKSINSLTKKGKNSQMLKQVLVNQREKNMEESYITKDLMLLISAYHGKPLDKIESDISRGRFISISLKERFGILKRYSFKCAYCGRSPPEVKLQVDHVKPKSKGGKEHNNLVPACVDCNSGKRDKELEPKQIIELIGED